MGEGGGTIIPNKKSLIDRLTSKESIPYYLTFTSIPIAGLAVYESIFHKENPEYGLTLGGISIVLSLTNYYVQRRLTQSH